MGIATHQNVRIADALFAKVQQRVLGILFGQPDRSFLSKEVIALARSGTGAVHRELQRLAASGLVTVRSVGWEKHYQADRQSPVFEELRSLVVKTVGLTEPLQEALAPLGDKVRAAFVYGAQVSGMDAGMHDASTGVDLMIVSDDLTHNEAYAALESAQQALDRSIDLTMVTVAEWQRRGQDDDYLLESVAALPKLFVIGSEHRLRPEGLGAEGLGAEGPDPGGLGAEGGNDVQS